MIKMTQKKCIQHPVVNTFLVPELIIFDLFFHQGEQFLNEVFGILRSHVSSLGGNAVTSYFMSYCVISYVPHKNQAQCLVNIGGDIVSASYVTK